MNVKMNLCVKILCACLRAKLMRSVPKMKDAPRGLACVCIILHCIFFYTGTTLVNSLT